MYLQVEPQCSVILPLAADYWALAGVPHGKLF